jgi:hypothetical protein
MDGLILLTQATWQRGLGEQYGEGCKSGYELVGVRAVCAEVNSG